MIGHLGDKKERSWSLFGASALLFSCLLIGGGGPHAPLFTAAIEMISIPVLLFAIAAYRLQPSGDRHLAAALLLIAYMLVVALLQLIPMPTPMWSNLPGRELLATAAHDFGGPGWRPLSVFPESTRRTALTLLPPVALFLAVVNLGTDDRKKLIYIVIAMAMASAALGSLQVALPDTMALYLYRLPPFGMPVGIFANRNHQADFLVVAVVLCFLLIRLERDHLRADAIKWVLFALIMVFAVVIMGTASRTGAALLVPAVAAGALLLRGPARFRLSGAALALRIGAVVALCSLLGWAISGYLLPRLVGRFSSGEDLRFEFWPDVIYAVHKFMPWGSGLGSFEPVFRSVERLDFVFPLSINRAHNDYLEIALETGVLGIAGILAFLTWFLVLTVRAWCSPTGACSTWMARAASIGLAVLLVHSLGDYPLRTHALAALFAVMCAMMLPNITTPERVRLRGRG